MKEGLDFTHDGDLKSWLESANEDGTDFPIQNLPFSVFCREGTAEPYRPGVAIGDQVLDLLSLYRAGLLPEAKILSATATSTLNALMSAPRHEQKALRQALSAGLAANAPAKAAWRSALVPQSAVAYAVPARIGDYTDFYTGIHHATTVGKLFRPENPLLPNYKWVPIGYHGRSSSIVVSGTPIKRPRGQIKASDAHAPQLAPSQRLDYELELGAFIGGSNPLGSPVSIDQAEDRVFGMVLLNDWSSRDVQAWEYQPLGPFQSKNFGSTISPWIVTMDALAPFRAPFTRPQGDPAPLAYLDSEKVRSSGGLDLQLEVWIQTANMHSSNQPPVKISESNFRDSYWTLGQLVAHHTIGGCNLQPGDLLGTGTQSGAEPGQGGSLLELSQGGKTPLSLPNGELRTFLQDGDWVILKARATRLGYRSIGFGACVGTILPAD